MTNPQNTSLQAVCRVCTMIAASCVAVEQKDAVLSQGYMMFVQANLPKRLRCLPQCRCNGPQLCGHMPVVLL